MSQGFSARPGHARSGQRVRQDDRRARAARAYSLYRERGDDRSAARVASWLATDSLAFRGQAAVARGWLQRAHRLLDELETDADHCWLAFHEGSITIGMEEDTAIARELGARAAELGRRFGVPELEMLALPPAERPDNHGAKHEAEAQITGRRPLEAAQSIDKQKRREIRSRRLRVV